jgi:hypothetical protein
MVSTAQIKMLSIEFPEGLDARACFAELKRYPAMLGELKRYPSMLGELKRYPAMLSELKRYPAMLGADLRIQLRPRGAIVSGEEPAELAVLLSPPGGWRGGLLTDQASLITRTKSL